MYDKQKIKKYDGSQFFLFFIKLIKQ